LAKKRSRKRKSNSAPSCGSGPADADGSLFGGSDPTGGGGNGAAAAISDGYSVVSLQDAARSRYLNYALSVITSRALPDVRDGMKPVQRRILYTMGQQRLTADAKPRKCATVCGTVMGSYHPHGDQAIYDALVRMAQPWLMRLPLIDGIGNFGSVDGDAPAAYRYTECRMAPPAGELLSEISQDTVHYRPNYDGTKSEPVVLPARLPNLLINGATGIAVGMATHIPPHNPGEVIKALLKLLENPELKTYQLLTNETIQGPDFPTGGQVLSTKDEVREVYKTGQGPIKLRGTWSDGHTTRASKTIVIDSIPYTVNKASLVEQIAQIVINRKLPPLLDVRDLSADDTRIELEIKKDADAAKVMAYLCKNTQLQLNFNVNLTCLIPTENPEVGRPERCDLREMLQHFLQFRLEVVTRRLQHELRALEKRLHILDGLRIVFDALDEIIAIIRKSEGKADAAQKIMERFPEDGQNGKGGGLDAEQTDAILELKLYRLARLEINLILEELKDKNKRAKEIRKLLDETDAAGRWGIVKSELQEAYKQYGKPDKRRTLTLSEDAVEEVAEFSAEDFIVAEDNHVLVTRDGWIKRQKEIKDPASTRMREGDAVLACVGGSTRHTLVLFSNFGTAYTARIADIPATTGYGEPIQKQFKLKDGEKVIAAFSLDPRSIGDIQAPDENHYPPSHAVAVSSDGYALRFGFEAFVEPSTRNGRRYARPKKGEEIIGVENIHGSETMIVVSRHARGLLCDIDEINYLSGPGKGVILIKLAKDDTVLGFKASMDDRDLMRVKTSRGASQTVSTAKYERTSRGGKGREIMKTGRFVEIEPEEPATPILLEDDDE